MQLVEFQNLGSFSMNQNLLALHKHMSNLALHTFQMYFKSNVILMVRFMTPELQKNIYPVKLHLASLRRKRTNIYEYLAAAQRTKFAVVLMD